jgi:hypothetical protein
LLLLAVDPSPSCPSLFLPVAQTDPSDFKNGVCTAVLAKSALPSKQSSRKKKRGGRVGAVNRTKDRIEEGKKVGNFITANRSIKDGKRVSRFGSS